MKVYIVIYGDDDEHAGYSVKKVFDSESKAESFIASIKTNPHYYEILDEEVE